MEANRNQLLEALKLLDTKSIVGVAASNGEVTLTTTDAHGAVTFATIPGSGVGTSKFHAKELLAAVRSGPDVFTMDSTDYTVPSMEVVHSPTPCNGLRKAFKQVGYAMHKPSPARLNQQGVLVDGENIIATDGHRLAIGENTPKLPNGFIPCGVVAKLGKLTDVTFGTTMRGLSFTGVVKGIRVTIELTNETINTTFPDYKQVIPSNATLSVAISTKLSIVDREYVFVTGEGVSSTTTESVSVRKINFKYLTQALRSFPSGTVTVSFDPTDGLGPLVIESYAQKALIMPMRM